MQPSYFLTSPDPDYLPKGARDPLGFQVVWQHQGKKLIPHLSTVSNLVRDFQLLCTARALYGDKDEKGWPRFFLRFEQLMAYARGLRYPTTGFGGVERVRYRLNESNRFPISNNPNDEILSNQRAYGIWGKYIRPYLEIGFEKDPLSRQVYESKLDSLRAQPELERILTKVLSNERFFIDKVTLAVLFPLFDLTDAERGFLRDKLVRMDSADAFQNRLYDYVDSNPPHTEFMLYPFLADFSRFLKPEEQHLRIILEEHAHTERILSPVNTVFRYLQTKPMWTRQEIEADDYISNCNTPVSFSFPTSEHHAQLLNELSTLLGTSNWNLVNGLVRRNSTVTDWRGGAAWITVTHDLLEVRHSEGALKKEKFNPETDHENPYFIPTFISLYQQLNTHE